MSLTKAALLQPQGLTTTERNLLALAGADAGRLIYNETTKGLEQWNGVAWVNVVSPDASETVKGIAELATQAEVTTGTDDARIVTPLKLATAVPAATEAKAGKVELATAAETTAGTDTTRAVHPAGLKVELDKKVDLASPSLTGVPTAPTAAAGTNTTQLATTAFVHAATPAASEIVKGVVELATAAETTTGTDATRAVHPAGLKVELDKLKHWNLNGTKLTAQESGGTKRGAILDFATCLPNGASHILTDNNTHFIAEQRASVGQALPDVPMAETSVASVDVTGIDTLLVIGNVAYSFNGGGQCPVVTSAKVVEKGTTTAMAASSKGLVASASTTLSYQLNCTVHFVKAGLDPAKIYSVQLFVVKAAPQGPITVMDPTLSVFGLKIKP
jgi:hypothetical protein